MSLGAKDPRGYRTVQAAQGTATSYDKTLRVDKRGRVGVSPARGAVSAPSHAAPSAVSVDPDTATAPQLGAAVNDLGAAHQALLGAHNALVAAHNDLLDALRQGNLIQGGPG